ncbi:MAG: tRNA lysidine(34) synthetase, partial [Gemmatimonadaceae bacterium]
MHRDPARAVYRAARRAARTTDKPFLLAVSGGLDSMALLGAMASVARRRIAGVATFDHRTGEAATRAVALVEAEAHRLGLPVVVGRMPELYAVADGREAAWRKARHAFLHGTATELRARVATAHTEDDQVETVLMRILRGSGARGLAALYAESPAARPFL